jgi:serine acetyltransferase
LFSKIAIMSSLRHVAQSAATAISLGLVLLHALPLVVGQSSSAGASSTVYATVVVARTGERTPELMAINNTLEITSYGANQMFNMVGATITTSARLHPQC